MRGPAGRRRHAMSDVEPPIGLNCPACGELARFTISPDQALCGNDSCRILMWDPAKTHEEMLADGVHEVDLRRGRLCVTGVRGSRFVPERARPGCRGRARSAGGRLSAARHLAGMRNAALGAASRLTPRSPMASASVVGSPPGRSRYSSLAVTSRRVTGLKIILTARFDSLERSVPRYVTQDCATLKFLALRWPARYSFLRTQQHVTHDGSGHS